MAEKKMMKSEGLEEFLKRLLNRYQVIAPVDVDGVILFQEVKDVQEILFHYSNASIPPKDWFFSQTQELFTYENTLKGLKFEDRAGLTRDYVLFGVRPCDLYSILLLDMVFLGEVSGEPYTDKYYQEKRERTTIIGLSCSDPDPSCFCTAFSLHPAKSQGGDLLFTEYNGEYLVEVKTQKGERLIQEESSLFYPPHHIDEEEMLLKVEEKIGEVDFKGVFEKFPKVYEGDFWDAYGARCLGCGICTYLCPTCHCFDLSDEATGEKGRRLRTWDSCMYSNFTLMTSGENPRPTQNERVRQRFFHKLRYFEERYNHSLCVGCGRCIQKCPVNIDIAEIISKVKELA